MNTSAMNANELAFAVAALGGHADTSALLKALIALVGEQEAFESIALAIEIVSNTLI
jgi:hypothetical protein